MADVKDWNSLGKSSCTKLVSDMAIRSLSRFRDFNEGKSDIYLTAKPDPEWERVSPRYTFLKTRAE